MELTAAIGLCIFVLAIFALLNVSKDGKDDWHDQDGK